ncbi:hypothetical protein CPB83DRAFT_778511, partial [Crepidotus variabilis]
RQHALSHYVLLIILFGASNGYCSSITESKHIKAVKEPGNGLVVSEHLHRCLSLYYALKNFQHFADVSQNSASYKGRHHLLFFVRVIVNQILNLKLL